MTLALIGGNREYTVLVADRRLTGADGSTVDDESSKGIVFNSPRTRIAVSFSGLATARGFQMKFELPQMLQAAAKEAPRPADLVGAVAARLTDAFSRLPPSVGDDAKRTVVLFAGYEYLDEGGVALFIRSVSNAIPRAAETRDFVVDEPEDSSRFNYVYAAGLWQVIPEEEVTALGDLINAAKPPEAVVGKASEIIREAARSEQSRGAIGEQLMSVIVPASRSAAPIGAYDTSFPTDTVFFPDEVSVDDDGAGIALMSRSVTSRALSPDEVQERFRAGRRGIPVDRTQKSRPIAYPKVGRNRPCPCGSGKKFKHCHGR